MRYIVAYNKYVKKLDRWQDIKKVFANIADAAEFVAKLEKLREWESVTITRER